MWKKRAIICYFCFYSDKTAVISDFKMLLCLVIPVVVDTTSYLIFFSSQEVVYFKT